MFSSERTVSACTYYQLKTHHGFILNKIILESFIISINNKKYFFFFYFRLNPTQARSATYFSPLLSMPNYIFIYSKFPIP